MNRNDNDNATIIITTLHNFSINHITEISTNILFFIYVSKSQFDTAVIIRIVNHQITKIPFLL